MVNFESPTCPLLLKDFIPAPDVQEFVQLYRIIHFRFGKEQSLPFKAYPPRPEHCLAFYPFDREKIVYQDSGKVVADLPAALYGQFSEVTNRHVGRDFLVVQIVFYPGALYRLTGIPAELFTNQYMDAELVFGKQLRAINEQLALIGTYNGMLDIVNLFIRSLIRKQCRQSLPLDAAFAGLLKADHRYSIRQLAADVYMSKRNLERVFFERTGVTPKMYERIIRFDKAFRMRNSKPEYSWLRIAVECGFHDHQHLAKVYKDFTGMSPGAFHQVEEKAPEREFGLVEGYYD